MKWERKSKLAHGFPLRLLRNSNCILKTRTLDQVIIFRPKTIWTKDVIFKKKNTYFNFDKKKVNDQQQENQLFFPMCPQKKGPPEITIKKNWQQAGRGDDVTPFVENRLASSKTRQKKWALQKSKPCSSTHSVQNITKKKKLQNL